MVITGTIICQTCNQTMDVVETTKVRIWYGQCPTCQSQNNTYNKE